MSEPAADPRQVIRSAVAGDQQAFTALYQEHSLPVFKYLLHMTNSQPVAEDLLQETFVAIWEGIDRFRGQATFKTWALRIAHHRFVDWLRASKPNEVSLDDADALSIPSGQDRLLTQKWQRNTIISVLGELPAYHREVIELAFIQDLSYREIAEIVDCPIGTVKSRLHYALQQMSGLFQQRDFDGGA
jgi:RNA polymerase sigma-70 factor (ECF subfamily)